MSDARVTTTLRAPSERAHAPVSTAELERRWSAVRGAMDGQGVNALLVHNNTDCMGGYVKYFSDVATSLGDPLSIVFGADDPMTMVMHGPHGDERQLPPEGDGLLRGVRTVSTAWSFSSVAYCQRYDAERLVKALAPYRRGVIGLVGLGQMPYPMIDWIKQELPDASFVDGAPLVDPIKAVKSSEERQAIAGVAAQQEAAFEAALAAIGPGVRESEVVGAALRASYDQGSEGGVLMVGAGPVGEPAGFNTRQHQNRRIEAGDHVVVLIETCGPGGLYTELGRTVVVGTATDEMRADHAFAVEAQRYCLDLIKPGVAPGEVFEAYNAYLREHGRPEERRLSCHGQGYDAVERPLVRSDETLPLAEHMNIACHPMYVAGGMTFWVCDGFFIEAAGVSAPHHGTARELFETG